VINLFFLPGQTTSGERESIIQSSGNQSVPSSTTLPPQSTEGESTPIEE
jgi:hypothetical protein